ncbi:hypothetical protein [Trueperella pecoris]|uniref:Uncharacterized protein n=1 Tax=Trueperella pecoris TaxID=2733571 RepID=A0A7M1QVB1_9ACTO|nr:hypothetical protein [Trueperella pecoris]QOR45741.1 hypothetical protein INS88_00430 [Trueperella pecoris]
MTTILVVNLVAIGALIHARAWRWVASFVLVGVDGFYREFWQNRELASGWKIMR